MFRWLKNRFGKREPPIQALDSIDIVGHRFDGGVDLAIVDSNPGDASPETRLLLRKKIAAYLKAINTDAFQVEFGFPEPEHTRIVVACSTQPSPKLAEWIEEWKPWVAENRARLILSVGPPR
ncbi:MAG: DUF6572 domain-containing protein [Gemmataceae bacterium]